MLASEEAFGQVPGNAWTAGLFSNFNRLFLMGCTKNYLLTLLQHCSEEKFGQDAIEFALVEGAMKLTYDLETDLRHIMGEPGKPESGRYDEFVEAYQRQCREHGDALVELYHASGLMEEILRPIPLSLTHDHEIS